MFEWDEPDRLTNLAKHGLDFIRADLPFDGRRRLDLPAPHPTERRMLAIADAELEATIASDPDETGMVVD